jgi:ACS family pantothenate transporter-like MFS transporter
MAWIPLVWFQQIHQPYVTSGNRAAAVIAGFNIVVFSTIAFLAHKESRAKARNGHLAGSSNPASDDGSKVDHVTVGVLSVPTQEKSEFA